MGKSQSKLSAEQLADLQKNTYCLCLPVSPVTNLMQSQSTRKNYSNGLFIQWIATYQLTPFQVQGIPQGLSIWYFG